MLVANASGGWRADIGKPAVAGPVFGWCVRLARKRWIVGSSASALGNLATAYSNLGNLQMAFPFSGLTIVRGVGDGAGKAARCVAWRIRHAVGEVQEMAAY